MLGVYSLLVSGVLQCLNEVRTRADYLAVFVMTVCMTLTIGEFAPGRIDHHGMQIVALMIIILGLARLFRAATGFLYPLRRHKSVEENGDHKCGWNCNSRFRRVTFSAMPCRTL
jgi:hypothetical protein